MPHHTVVWSLSALCFVSLSCGRVVASEDAGVQADVDAARSDAGVASDAAALDAAASDAASADAASPDADTSDGCEPFDPPAGSESIIDDLCESAAGHNPSADPTFSPISPCPGTGQYGTLIRLDSAQQLDGCPATGPILRVIPPPVDGALTQAMTSEDVLVQEGDRVVVRLACSGDTPDCRARVQVNVAWTDPEGNRELRGLFNELIEGEKLYDVDAPIDPDAVGQEVSIVIVPMTQTEGTADILIQDPRLVR